MKKLKTRNNLQIQKKKVNIKMRPAKRKMYYIFRLLPFHALLVEVRETVTTYRNENRAEP